MKFKVLNILLVIFLIMSCIFGAYAPVSEAISYYMLLGGWGVAACKLSYEYIKAAKNGEYFKGEIFGVAAGTLLFFMGRQTEADVFMTTVVCAGEILKYIYQTTDRKIEKIRSYLPKTAVVFKDGEETEIDARELEPGNIVIVNTDEKIPADGVVFRGQSMVDGKYFNIDTPYEASMGHKVLAGYVNTGNTLQVEVTASWENSFFNRAIHRADQAAGSVSHLDVKFKLYEKILTVLVLIGAGAAAVGMVVFGAVETSAAVVTGVVAASSLVLYNTAKVAGKSTASFIYDRLKEGIVIGCREACSSISKVEGLILEDDGRLAEGDYELISIMENEGVTKEEILTFAAHLHYFSKSNLAKAVVKGYQQLAKYEGLNEETAIRFTAVSHVEEIPGKGITGKVAGRFVCAGNEKLMALLNISKLPQVEENTVVHVAVDQKHMGSLVLRYIPKEGMEEVFEQWNKAGVNNYAVDKGNFEELLEELREASSEDGTVAHITATPGGKAEEDADVKVVIDTVNSRELYDGDIVTGTNDLTVISRLKTLILKRSKKLKVQGICLLAVKTAGYAAAAFFGISIIVPVIADALITVGYAKFNI